MGKRKRNEEAAPEVDPDVSDDGLDHSDVEEAVAAGRIVPQSSVPLNINNREGLNQALAEISQELPWVERLEVVAAESIPADHVNDDLKLELAFYGQALAAVSAARGELGRLGVAHRRPDDYFAEMLKSDGHMQKIKDKLILEQKKMTAVENRKKDKAGSMFSKQVAAEKVKAKAADKRSQLDNIKQWRKNKGDARPSLSNDADLEGMMSGKGAAGADRGRGGADRGRSGGGAGARGRSSSGPGGRGSIFKREAKDKKFGFGGKPKHFAKSNDRESAGANTGFSRRDNKAPFFPKRGGGKAGGSAGKGSSRPGKSTRSASRGRAASGRGGKR